MKCRDFRRTIPRCLERRSDLPCERPPAVADVVPAVQSQHIAAVVFSVKSPCPVAVSPASIRLLSGVAVTVMAGEACPGEGRGPAIHGFADRTEERCGCR